MLVIAFVSSNFAEYLIAHWFRSRSKDIMLAAFKYLDF